MESSLWFETIFWDGPVYILRGQRLLFPNKTVVLSHKIIFVLANAILSRSPLFAKVPVYGF